MKTPKRYHSAEEFNAEIDRLNALFPELEEKAKEARLKADFYWQEMDIHQKDYKIAWKRASKEERNKMEEPVVVFKKLKRAAKRAKGAIGRNEKAILKLKNGLAEFQTETMPFLEDRSVEVR